MDDPRVVLIEFNELSPALLDRFIAEGELPNFAAFRAASDVFTTDAGESDAALVPWIQWPSVHTGLPYAEHGIYHLGDAERCAAPTIESVLSDAGAARRHLRRHEHPAAAGPRLSPAGPMGQGRARRARVAAAVL